MQAEKKRFQVQLFQGVEHGFALRGDVNNAYERKYHSSMLQGTTSSLVIGYTKEQSLKGIAEWFDLWLPQDTASSAKM